MHRNNYRDAISIRLHVQYTDSPNRKVVYTLPVKREVARNQVLKQKPGDVYRLSAARSAARDGFEANKHLSPIEAQAQVQHAEGVAQILRENVVQGTSVDSEGNKYKLNIHEHTERGDNETLMGSGRNTTKGKCAPL